MSFLHFCIKATTQDFERHSVIGKIRSQRSEIIPVPAIFSFFGFISGHCQLVPIIDWIGQKSVWEIDSLTPGRSLLPQLLQQEQRRQPPLKHLRATQGGTAMGKGDYSTFTVTVHGLMSRNPNVIAINHHHCSVGCKWKILVNDLNCTLHWTWAQCLSEMFYCSLAVVKSKGTREWTWAALGGQNQPLTSVRSWCLPVKYDG